MAFCTFNIRENLPLVKSLTRQKSNLHYMYVVGTRFLRCAAVLIDKECLDQNK
jgi:hypothetical protein